MAGGMSDFGKGVGNFFQDSRETVPNAIDAAKKGDIAGVAEAGLRPITNAWETAKGNLKKGKGGAAGSITGIDPAAIPGVEGPGPAPTIAVPTVGPVVPAAPGAAKIDFKADANYMGDAGTAQAALMQQLARQANGQGPSLAEQQLKQAQEANVAAVMAQLASARGGANPMLQRQAMQTSSDIQAQTARDAATARLQEQLQAQGLLGQVSGQAINQGLTQRGQDIGLATSQAGLDQQAALTGYGAQVDAGKTLFLSQQQAALAQADLAARYAGMGMDAQKANQLAQLQIQDMILRGQLGGAQVAAGQQASNNQMMGGLASGAGAIIGGIYGGGAGAAVGSQAGGALAGGATPQQRASVESQPTFVGPPTSASSNQTQATYSDENLKTNISDGSASLEKMLSALSAKDYEYKDKKHGEGRFTGPMAQELLKSEAGKSLVKQGPDGLMVDTGRAALAALSANAMLLERVRQLESKKKRGH